jgi:hypothetical protein
MVNELQGAEFVYRQLVSNRERITGLQMHHDRRLFKITDFDDSSEGDAVILLVQVINSRKSKINLQD